MPRFRQPVCKSRPGDAKAIDDDVHCGAPPDRGCTALLWQGKGARQIPPRSGLVQRLAAKLQPRLMLSSRVSSTAPAQLNPRPTASAACWGSQVLYRPDWRGG